MLLRAEDVGRIERAAARGEAAVGAALARLDPGLGAVAVPVAGGHVVVLGPGMYVNRGLGLGLGVEVTADDLAVLEGVARAGGVAAETEVTPWADRSLLAATAARGYRAVGFRSTLVRPLPGDAVAPAAGFDVEEVADGAGLAVWQATAAEGFGYTTDEERRISDLYIAAVGSLVETHLYVARSGGREVGVASLAIRDGVGILGGMTTLPAARGSGVQGDLIRFRLGVASAAGCDVAMSSAAPGSGSERNLLRNGFSIAYTTLTVRRPAAS